MDTDSLLSQNWPPSLPVRWRSCSETDFATTEKHGQKKTEKTAWNATEFLISIDLGKVWPPLPCTATVDAPHFFLGPGDYCETYLPGSRLCPCLGPLDFHRWLGGWLLLWGCSYPIPGGHPRWFLLLHPL